MRSEQVGVGRRLSRLIWYQRKNSPEHPKARFSFYMYKSTAADTDQGDMNPINERVQNITRRHFFRQGGPPSAGRLTSLLGGEQVARSHHSETADALRPQAGDLPAWSAVRRRWISMTTNPS